MSVEAIPKNQVQRARVILDSLVQGVHPKTGGTLPEDSIINEIDVSRAMVTAVIALDQMSARLARRAGRAESVGKAWTDEEERRLKGEFSANEPIALIATKHGRTIRAIELRIEKLGLMTGDQKTSANSFGGRVKRSGKK